MMPSIPGVGPLGQSVVIPAQAGIHASIAAQVESCVGARLRGHDVGARCARQLNMFDSAS
jgi:hypothetical protein